MGSMRIRVVGRFVALGGLVMLIAAASCRLYEPSNKPIDACRLSCRHKASAQCTESECDRGCEFILDRLVEREGETVIACVAARARRCSDIVWADCAARVGPHLDGGPPGYVPRTTEDDTP